MRHYTAARAWGDILPRYVFLEPLLRGKRVLELGCADGVGAAFLLARGASSVQAMDREGPELAAALRASRRPGLAFRAHDGRRLELPSAAFDVAVAFELGERFDSVLLGELERVLRPEGLLITALANPAQASFGELVGPRPGSEAPPFERFVALLQERFPAVSVLAQTPFLGFSLGWMGAEAEELPLEMDSSLLPDGAEDVAHYLVLCGREPVALESQALVQLSYGQVVRELLGHPAARPAEPAGPPAPDEALEALRGERDALRAEVDAAREASARAGAGEAERAGLRQALEEARTLVGRRQDELDEQATWLAAARTELARLGEELAGLREAQAGSARRLAEREQELQAGARRERMREQTELGLRERVQALEAELVQARLERDGARAERQTAEAEREVLRVEAERAQVGLQAARQAAVEHESERARWAGDQAALVARAEQQLQALRSREAEVAQAQAAREELERERAAGRAAGAALEARLEALGQDRDALRRAREDQEESLLRLQQKLTGEAEARLELERRLGEQAARNRELESDLVDVVNRVEEGEARAQEATRLTEIWRARLEHEDEGRREAQEKIDELTRELYAARKQEEELLAALELMHAAALEQVEAREALAVELEEHRALEREAAGEHEAALLALEAERDGLATRVAELEQELERGREVAQAEVERARRDLSEHQARWEQGGAQELARLRQALLDERRAREEGLAERDRAVEHAQGELRRQAEQTGLARAEAEEARARAESARSEARLWTERLEAAALQLAAREARSVELGEALELAAERERILQERLAALQRQVAELEQGIGRELEELGARLRRRDEQLGILTERLSDLDAQRNRLLERSARLEAEVGQAWAEVAPARRRAELEAAARLRAEREAEVQLARLRGERGQAEEAAREAEEAAREAEERLLELGAAQEALTTAQRGWFHKVRSLEEQLHAARGELEGLRSRVEAQASALAAREAERASLLQDIAEREQHVRLLEHELAGAQERLGRLETELKRMTGQP
jgi:chromosome segregation ATPase/SAM-dependent methyltransferase